MNFPSSAGRHYAHDDFDSAEVFRVIGCGLLIGLLGLRPPRAVPLHRYGHRLFSARIGCSPPAHPMVDGLGGLWVGYFAILAA